MKKIYFLILFFIGFSFLNAQCTVNDGTDFKAVFLQSRNDYSDYQVGTRSSNWYGASHSEQSVRPYLFVEYEETSGNGKIHLKNGKLKLSSGKIQL